MKLNWIDLVEHHIKIHEGIELQAFLKWKNAAYSELKNESFLLKEISKNNVKFIRKRYKLNLQCKLRI